MEQFITEGKRRSVVNGQTKPDVEHQHFHFTSGKKNVSATKESNMLVMRRVPKPFKVDWILVTNF